LSRQDKLRKRFFKKPIPNDFSPDELVTLINGYVADGYNLTIVPGGKHPMKVVHIPSGTVIPIPIHGKQIGEAYIAQVKALLIEIGACE